MKLGVGSLLFFLVVLFPAGGVASAVSPADFGGHPDDGEDDTAAIREALAAAASAPGGTVRFEPGVYRLSGEEEGRGPLFRVHRANGLKIEGNGAVLLVTTPTIGLFHFREARDLVLRNLTVRYDPLPFAWGRVVELRRADRGLVVATDAASPSFGAPWVRRNGQWGCFLDPEIPGRLLADAPNVVFLREPPVDEGDNRFLLRLDNPFGKISMIETGDTFVLNARDNRSPVFFAAASNGVRLEGVVVEQCPGGHFLAVDSEDLSVLGCEARIAPGLPKSGNADFVHFQNCRGPIRIEGNEVAGITDDAVNLYSKPFLPLEREGDRRVRLSRVAGRLDAREGAGRIRVGDRLVFYDRDRGEIALRTRAEAADPETGWVRLADELPPEVDSDGRWSVYGAEYARGVRIAGNEFRDLRRFGVFLKAYEAEIRDNLFEGLSGAALFLSNEPNHYREGLFCEDVVIEGNRFENCGFSANFEANPSWAAVTLQALRMPHRPAPLTAAHRGIRIENNVFSGNRRDVFLRNVEGMAIDDALTRKAE